MTCKEVLYNYINANEGWHKKVHLYAIAEDWSPETVGRELRLLEEEEKIEVDYYSGKYSNGLAKYRIKQPLKKTIYKVIGMDKEIITYA